MAIALFVEETTDNNVFPGSLFSKLSINLVDYSSDLKSDEFYVKTWGTQKNWYKQILKSEFIEDTGKQIVMDFSAYSLIAEIWRIPQ